MLNGSQLFAAPGYIGRNPGFDQPGSPEGGLIIGFERARVVLKGHDFSRAARTEGWFRRHKFTEP
jgi:hypothetical protein